MSAKLTTKNKKQKAVFNHKGFIPEYDQLKSTVDSLKKEGKKIVLTQGVYDLIHQGHAIYLEKAKSYGDVLIVGVDSDNLTRKRKGSNRPIVPQEERLSMLLHIKHVDIVTLREIEHGMGGLIRLIKPDFLVVSKTTKDFPEKDTMVYKKYCKNIVMLPPQATTSTTARIRTLTIEGVENLAQEIYKTIEDFLNKIKNV